MFVLKYTGVSEKGNFNSWRKGTEDVYCKVGEATW